MVSVKVPEPQFEGQTKTKLGNSEVKGIVEALVNEKFSSYLSEHPADAKKIISKVLKQLGLREATRKAKIWRGAKARWIPGHCPESSPIVRREIRR